MAVFEYKAIDMDASDLGGTIVADSPRQARDILRDRGLTVTEVRNMQTAGKANFAGRSRARRGRGETITFIRDLSTLIKAGIPLLPALNTLSAQHSRHFKAVVQDLADQVAAGLSLADAMNRHSGYFDELCVSIVRVGENTGHLDESLKKLADFKEKAHRLRSRVTTALIYPAIVAIFGVTVSIFLMTFAVPKVLGTLVQAGKELPVITRIVMASSDILIGWWWAIILVVACMVLAIKAVLRSSRGRMAADRLILRVPVIGELIRKENTSRMAIVMGSLLSSGLEFIEAIRITQRTMRNSVFRKAMDDYEAAITAGSDVAAPLAASGVFRPMVVQMLAVGQESGQLEEMLQQLAETYDQEVATATQRLTAVMEPLLIVILAILVGFIAFATILPILEVSNVL